MSNHPFVPSPGRTVNIDVSSSSQSVKLGGLECSLRVMNNGTATVWIAFGGSNIAATTTADIPIGPGGTEVFTAALNGGTPELYVAAIAAGSTGKIYFTPGRGI